MKESFVIIPLLEISPKYQTTINESMPLREVLDELPDKEGVRIWKAEKWGRRIRAFRKLKGFTQEEICERS